MTRRDVTWRGVAWRGGPHETKILNQTINTSASGGVWVEGKGEGDGGGSRRKKYRTSKAARQ